MEFNIEKLLKILENKSTKINYSDIREFENAFEKFGLPAGRMISGSKIPPKGCQCVWNANIIIKPIGKIWYGDLNITRDEPKLKKISKFIGKTLYVLREHDCRFNTENDDIDNLIKKSVWNTGE